MKQIITTACLLFITVCGAQINFVKHADLLLNAHRAKELKDAKKALSLYEEAFALHSDNSIGDYLYAANCAAQLNNKTSCEKWIIEAIQTKKVEKKSILKFSENEIYQRCATKILLKYPVYLSKYYKNLENPMAYFKIQELINRDQFSRKINDYHFGVSDAEKEEAYEGFLKSQAPKDSVARRKYQSILFPKVSKVHEEYKLKIKRYTDSLNLVSLMDITRDYGWQKEGWLLLWHQRGYYGKKNWVWNYFKPFIDNEIKEGTISPSFWAQFEDFKSIRETGKSIYGYHPGKVDASTVNKKRKSIGLPVLTKAEITHRNNNPYGGRLF
ncbi:MAG: hypothetical protein JKY02_01290 [Flavobacteriaceae bacterium]|nr:hypothetical protein [Flavobacteriaceae bacterium]